MEEGIIKYSANVFDQQPKDEEAEIDVDRLYTGIRQLEIENDILKNINGNRKYKR